MFFDLLRKGLFLKLAEIEDTTKFKKIYGELFNKVENTVRKGDYFSMTDELRERYIRELYKTADYDLSSLKIAVKKIGKETYLSGSDQFRNILARCELL